MIPGERDAFLQTASCHHSLKSKLGVAQTSLDNTIEDLEFLREQLTIMEVNTARVYNWDVKRRRERREKEAERLAAGGKSEQ